MRASVYRRIIVSDILSLNNEQAEAAAHKTGPLLLLAGPGTGKTATLTARIKFLVDSGVPESEILAITFTQAAAQEMLDRVENLLGHVPGCTIGTFHRVANVLMKMYPSGFARLRGRRLVEDSKCLHLVKEISTVLIRKKTGRIDRVNTDDIDELSDQILSVKDRLSGTETHHKLFDLDPLAQEGYIEYQQQLDAIKGYDFADLILSAVDALGQAKIHRSVVSRWKYVLVDEYQDINPSQHEMIRRLLGREQNLWAVGDDDQALYGWRQADVRLLLNFATEYPGAKILYLTVNYRCPMNVLWMANKLIRNNRLRFPKVLSGVKPANTVITIHRAGTERSEAVWIARHIGHQINDGSQPGDFAILGRTSSLLPPIARALSAENIPCRIRGAPPFWSQGVVRTALSLFASLLGEWPEDIAPAKSWMLERASAGLRVRGYHDVLEYVVNFLKNNPARNSKMGEAKAQWDTTLDDFLLQAKSVNSPEELVVKMRVDDDDDDSVVTLCTIHASKGLQWPHVFVCGMEEGIMPMSRSIDLEEERRIAYVALTRASSSLTITSAVERNRVDHELSRYVVEMNRMMPRNYVVDGKGQAYS